MSQVEDDESPRKLPTLNVAERPTRNRKRNSRFFNDDEDTNWVTRSPRKKQPSTSSQNASNKEHETSQKPSGSGQTPSRQGTTIKSEPKSIKAVFEKEKQSGPVPPAGFTVRTKQRVSALKGPDKIGVANACHRLKNFLKLPKAHKWVVYEFFYSNLDDCLFNSENEFSNYLKQSFPFLKTRNLTRAEWSRIRRFMGKPRRCSPAFFAEEIRSLHEKRDFVRHLQQRLVPKLSLVEHLPAEIPLSLVIGTRVMAYVLSKDGLFVGTIDAVDTQNYSYRISFDRPEIGTMSCFDYEVLSLERVDKMPIEYFIQRPRAHPPPRAFFPSSFKSDTDPLLSASINDGPRFGSGGFPLEFLTLIVQLTRVLTEKKSKIDKLTEMNAVAEKTHLQREKVSSTFRKKYASILLELSSLNHDLEECLEGIHKYCEELSPDQDHSLLSHPLAGRAKINEEANNVLQLANGDPPMVGNEAHLDLIKQLIVVLLQIKSATEKKHSTFELRSLEEAIKELELKITPRDTTVFQNEVEVHLLHIKKLLTEKATDNLRVRVENTSGTIERT